MPLENTGPECFWSAAQDHWAITAHVPATGMVKKVTTIPDSLKGGTKRQISYQGGARAPGAPPQFRRLCCVVIVFPNEASLCKC